MEKTREKREKEAEQVLRQGKHAESSIENAGKKGAVDRRQLSHLKRNGNARLGIDCREETGRDVRGKEAIAGGRSEETGRMGIRMHEKSTRCRSRRRSHGQGYEWSDADGDFDVLAGLTVLTLPTVHPASLQFGSVFRSLGNGRGG